MHLNAHFVKVVLAAFLSWIRKISRAKLGRFGFILDDASEKNSSWRLCLFPFHLVCIWDRINTLLVCPATPQSKNREDWGFPGIFFLVRGESPQDKLEIPHFSTQDSQLCGFLLRGSAAKYTTNQGCDRLLLILEAPEIRNSWVSLSVLFPFGAPCSFSTKTLDHFSVSTPFCYNQGEPLV